jgi:hypothetical protein
LVVFIFWVQVVKSTTHVWFSNLPLPAGRHSGFHTENGRYGSAGHRGEPSPFGSIPPLESGIARKFDRDFYPGSGCAVANTGFSNGPGLDHRSKDSDERHKRESFTVSGDGRDGGSSAVNDQPVRPYHSQVLSEVENSSWERDRSKGLISSGSWDSSQRSERDHRERLSGKPDSYSRREGKFSQYDAGRDWSQGAVATVFPAIRWVEPKTQFLASTGDARKDLLLLVRLELQLMPQVMEAQRRMCLDLKGWMCLVVYPLHNTHHTRPRPQRCMILLVTMETNPHLPSDLGLVGVKALLNMRKRRLWRQTRFLPHLQDLQCPKVEGRLLVLLFQALQQKHFKLRNCTQQRKARFLLFPILVPHLR